MRKIVSILIILPFLVGNMSAYADSNLAVQSIMQPLGNHQISDIAKIKAELLYLMSSDGIIQKAFQEHKEARRKIEVVNGKDNRISGNPFGRRRPYF